MDIKQPELGRKISELRKAKGLTQEELVEKCNLNVRTIQRIEAGEVTPRSYTIKALFEALDFKWEELKNGLVDEDKKVPAYLYFAFAAGLIYFFLAFFEIGQLGLMIWAINTIGRRNSPDSIFTIELQA
jgi:transcriptional regulator with XRE-family HTH domain